MADAVFKRIYQDLRGKITSAQLKVGDQLATESELAASYGVSALTIRHAQSLLVKEGLIVKQQGRGTFVAELPSGLRRVLLVCGVAVDAGSGPSIYYTQTIRRCRERLAEDGLSMDVAWIDNNDHATALAYCDPHRLRDYTGYVFLGCSERHPLLKAARASDLNWVLLGRLDASPHAIWRDARAGIRQAVDSLLGIEGMPPETPFLVVSLHGSQTESAAAILAERGLSAEYLEITYRDSVAEHEISSYLTVRQHLAEGSARRILFMDDVLARGGTRAILEAQTKRPQQVELAVLSNILATVPYGLPVHYVVHDSEAEADMATASLLTQIAGDPAPTSCHHYFPIGRHTEMTPAMARSMVAARQTQPQEALTK